MSLLMQALKKAERAKLNSLQESEPDKPSAAFDDVLELAPLDAPAPQPELTLELEPAPPPTPEAAPLEFASAAKAPEPAAAPASASPSATPQATPSQAQAASPPRATGGASTAGKRSETGSGTPAGAGAAARARAAAAAPAVRVALDPARLRVIVLAAIAALIALVFAYVYWHAVYGRPSSKLPMVPMPPLNAPAANGAAVPATPAELLPLPEPAPASAEPNDSKLQALQSRLDQQERELATVQQLAQTQLANARAPETLPPLAAPDNGDIRVLRNNNVPQLNPALQNGYQALNGGDLGSARQQYEEVLQQEPNNRDALLGMAALALRQNQGQQAGALYARLLELDPQDPDALAGLVGLRQGDPGKNEIRLKNLLQQHPDSAPLLFALGNLYASQGRWPEAQPIFFRAYTTAPDNADYAFNLAVGLDHLNQGKLALGYYQRALVLAQQGAAGFERATARRRVQELGGN